MGQLIGFGAGCALILGFIFAPAAPVRGQPAGKGTPNPNADLLALGMKFDGAMSCSDKSCHGAAKAATTGSGPRLTNELTTWSKKDQHAKAFTALATPNTKKHPEWANIGKNMGIADVTTSDQCLGCHALNAPAAQRGERFNLKEGVTCNSCHGPSGGPAAGPKEKGWNTQHQAEGWVAKQHAAFKGDDAALLKATGLLNTKTILFRAEKCTSCHLAIDAEMVKAGHPQPTFELAYYGEFEPKHWRDPAGYYNTKVWAAGQYVCLRESMKLLASRAGDSGIDAALLKGTWQQAMGHWAMFKQLIAAGVVTDPGLAARADALKATAGDKAKAAAMATEAAAIAAGVEKTKDAFDKYDPQQADSNKLLAAIAADTTLAADYAVHGVEQQAFAIYDLYAAYATNAKPADQKDVDKLIGKLFGPIDDEKVDPAAYNKDLAAVTAKLPK